MLKGFESGRLGEFLLPGPRDLCQSGLRQTNGLKSISFLNQPNLEAACSEPNLLRMPCVLLTKAAKVTASEFLNIFTAPKQTPIREAGKFLDVSANRNSIWHAINGSKGAPAKPASKTAEPKEPEAMTVSDQKAIKSILLIATLMKL